MDQARRLSNHCETGSNTFWGGYAGYFQDPDQHLWEIAGSCVGSQRIKKEAKMISKIFVNLL
jgi:hypothetical protein